MGNIKISRYYFKVSCQSSSKTWLTDSPKGLKSFLWAKVFEWKFQEVVRQKISKKRNCFLKMHTCIFSVHQHMLSSTSSHIKQFILWKHRQAMVSFTLSMFLWTVLTSDKTNFIDTVTWNCIWCVSDDTCSICDSWENKMNFYFPHVCTQ